MNTNQNQNLAQRASISQMLVKALVYLVQLEKVVDSWKMVEQAKTIVSQDGPVWQTTFTILFLVRRVNFMMI